jgi:hypothetical protein
MSLTSYRAAPPRGLVFAFAAVFGPVWRLRAGGRFGEEKRFRVMVCAAVLGRPGGDRLSRVLRRSTMGAEGFDGRVRNGIGFGPLAWATRPAKHSAGEAGDGNWATRKQGSFAWRPGYCPVPIPLLLMSLVFRAPRRWRRRALINESDGVRTSY